MSMAQLSPNSVIANPAHLNPQVKAEQATSAPQINQDALQSVQASRSDTVTISAQALQKAARD
ncbi:MAG: hypothetical protein PHH91_01095 [Desulfuromonadaceae bacterium]|nr:hypothetical protein [Desulfuromonadaceae bacterium]